jgi:hypothetical protein
MFTGSVVWRGIIYTLLMIFGKMACGLWLVRFAMSIPKPIHPRKLKMIMSTSKNHFWGRKTQDAHHIKQSPAEGVEIRERIPTATEQCEGQHHRLNDVDDDQNRNTTHHSYTSNTAPSIPDATNQNLSKNPSKPISLYPASILGFAMVSRGEIGFLISSLADSNGIFSRGGNEDVFLIVTWAIVLCTVIGPISVGLLVKRLRRLERVKEQGGNGRDVLGVWGVR